MRPVGSEAADRPGLDMPAPHERGPAVWRVADVDVWALWRRIFDAGAPGEGASSGGPAEASAFGSSTHGAARRASGTGGGEPRVEATVAALGAERSGASPPPWGGSRRLAASPAAAKRSPGTAAESEREVPHGPASGARAVAHEAVGPESGAAAPAATLRTATTPAGSIVAGGPVATDAPIAAAASDAAAHDGAPILSSSASAPAGTADDATGSRGGPTARQAVVPSTGRGISAGLMPAPGGPPRPGAPDAAPCDRDSRAAREAVHVRCQSDGSVAVVVRDATLAPALAVRWSLETAYALRGEHAALQRVTLNGRTVYLRGAAPGEPRAATAGLCFAC